MMVDFSWLIIKLTFLSTFKNKENLFFILNFKEILTTKNARKVNFQACLFIIKSKEIIIS
jgi:hypothetical protein